MDNLKCHVGNFNQSRVDFNIITKKDFMMLMNPPSEVEFPSYKNQIVICALKKKESG